jgi:hypothetical protein
MAIDLPLDLQVAIVNPSGVPAGSGLILDTHHILTCAHVILTVTGGKAADPPPWDSDIDFRFLPWRSGEQPRARLVRNAWKATEGVPGDSGLRDLALLRVEKPLPSPTEYWRIYPGVHVPRSRVTILAFPEGQSAGIRADIIFKGEVADGWWQADNTPEAQYKIQPGFSGCPLFEPNTERVLGLIAEAERGGPRVGFLIPGSVLLKFLREVGDKLGQPEFADQFRARAPLFDVPDLPRNLLCRETLVQSVTDMVLGESKAAVGLVGLRGMGGIGKTVVARLLVEHDTVRRRFHDGVYWLTVGENKSLTEVESLQQKLLTRLSGKSRADLTLDGLREAIVKELEGQSVLLVVDDVWTPNDVHAFDIRRKGCAVVFTSRKRSGFDAHGVTVKDVEFLSETEAETLFRDHAGLGVDAPLVEAQRQILGHCNRHVLGVVVAGSMVRKHPQKATFILDRLERADVRRIVASVPEYRRSSAYPGQETSLFRMLQTSFDLLEDGQKGLFADFGIFREDTPIPAEAVELLGFAAGLDELETDESVKSLDDASLLTYHEGEQLGSPYVTLHDLQRDFAVCLAQDLRASHARFVDAYRKRFGGSFYDANGRSNMKYFRKFMIHHLLGAGLIEEALTLLIDPDWLAHRLAAKDQILEIIGDYDRGIAAS